MKIATWNVERLKKKKYREEIIDACNSIQADILVLTENDEMIDPEYYKYCCHTPTPPPLEIEGYDDPMPYKPSEHRVSIYTNYKIIAQHTTFDKYTSLCLELGQKKVIF